MTKAEHGRDHCMSANKEKTTEFLKPLSASEVEI